jgi:glutathione reductase (NADPH)
LRGFDLDLRQALCEAMTAEGITLRPDIQPRRVVADGARRILDLGKNAAPIEVDLVLFATGRVPNVSDLGLDRAGVATSPSGAVIVDADLRTSQPHIYAIGDVTNRLNLTPVATAEGHALADTLFGGRPRHVSLKNVPTAVFSAPPLATVGLTEQDAAAVAPIDVYVNHFTALRHNLTGRNRHTMMKLVVDQTTQRVVGLHMLGDDAPEIVQGFAVAVVMGATKADFDRTIGIHPTAAEEFVTLRSRTREAGVAKAAE